MNIKIIFVYSKNTNQITATMKIFWITALCCSTMLNASPVLITSIDAHEKEKKERKKKNKKNVPSRNFHSIKNWSVTVEYANGSKIQKIIRVQKDSDKSAMEAAFAEAARFLKKEKSVQYYTVTPVTENKYVLLAEGK